MAKPTFADLWELLNYDFETGKLWWKRRDIKWSPSRQENNRWNTMWADREAFRHSCPVNRYKVGALLGKSYKAHHLIWVMCYGYWPTKEIDHIDGDRTNNRLTNLREVTLAENMKNQSIYSSNTSGMQGVTFKKSMNKWSVRANKDGKRLHLGYYTSFDEAVRVRKQAEIEYGYHPNHGRQKTIYDIKPPSGRLRD